MHYGLKTRPLLRLFPIAVLSASVVLAASVLPAAAFAVEKPVPPETNPTGDIPDTQVFITYHSPQDFTIKVPEGWARTDLPYGARFVDKLDGVTITVRPSAAVPTIETAKNSVVPRMKAQGRAVKVSRVEAVKLPAGQAIRIVYSANSEPNPVTNKQVRIEGNRYLLFSYGRLASLDLYAPYGADNADQWHLMSRSFRWK